MIQMCGNCGGHGRMPDGMSIYSTTEVTIRPQSKCPACEGSGYVHTRPATREEAGIVQPLFTFEPALGAKK